MEVLYPRCAGLDVHQQTVVACARIASGSTVQQEVRTFGTTTGDLLALCEAFGGHMGADHSRQRVVIRNGQGGIAQLRGPLHQLIGMRGAAQEGEIRSGGEFDVADQASLQSLRSLA